MISQTPDLAAVVEHLERLEREVGREKRRNRWLLVAVGLGLMGVILAWTLANPAATAQAQGSKVIRADQFLLEDEHGKPRASLFLHSDGPVLALLDENGKPRATLAAAKAGPSLALHDEMSRTRVALRLDKDGPVVSLACENGTTCVWVTVNKNGPRLILWNENGKAIWTEP
jgi:hypothetical protein